MARAMKDSGIEWIGEIPESWETIKIKYLFSINSGESISKEEFVLDGSYPVIGANGEIGRTNKYNNERNIITTGRVGTIGTTHIFGKSWITDNVLRLFSKTKDNLKYYCFTIPFFDFNEMTSGTAMPLITSTKLYNQFVPFLPIDEQERIAEFLDRKCGEIDEVIAKTEKTIEEYKALKQSVITEAVTKGIRPNRPMKDSGIEWIGQIPEEWHKLKLKYCTYIRARLGWKGLKAEEYVESGYPLLSAFNIVNSRLDFENNINFINKFRYDESPEIKLAINDILLVKDGAGIGKCAIVDTLPIESTANGSLAVITVTDFLYPKFLYYYFLSKMFQKYIDRIKDGMGVPHLFQSDLREIEIVYPVIEEQKSVANYLDTKCAEIDKLIESKQQLLTELETYKKSVIYEYVTGKKEIKK